MDRTALDAAYNNTAHIGQRNRDDYVASWTKRSELIRKSLGGRLDLRYGAGARHRLDVFPCGAPAAPTLVHIHGGYWQSGDKETSAFLAEGVLAAGFNLVLVEYTLAPAARMDQIVSEVRGSVAWVIDHAKEIGGDPSRVFVSGHSAGAHLIAMTMTEKRLAGGIAISGIYDLEPIRLNYLNEKIDLNSAEVDRNSPIRRLPANGSPLVVTVGLGELPELVRQSKDYAAAWRLHGLHGKYFPLAKHDHFSILEELARPNGALIAVLKDLAHI